MNQILTGFASKQEKTDQLMVFFNVLNCVILNCSYLIFDIHEHRPCFIKALKNIIIELFMGFYFYKSCWKEFSAHRGACASPSSGTKTNFVNFGTSSNAELEVLLSKSESIVLAKTC